MRVSGGKAGESKKRHFPRKACVVGSTYHAAKENRINPGKTPASLGSRPKGKHMPKVMALCFGKSPFQRSQRYFCAGEAERRGGEKQKKVVGKWSSMEGPILTKRTFRRRAKRPGGVSGFGGHLESVMLSFQEEKGMCFQEGLSGEPAHHC